MGGGYSVTTTSLRPRHPAPITHHSPPIWHLPCPTDLHTTREDPMFDDERKKEEHAMPDFPAQRDDSPYAALSDSFGATQNSGGALLSNDEELGHGPGRGAD